MSELNTAAGNILNRLTAAPTFHPGNADLFTDWNLQAGDVITVSADGEDYAMPIYNMKLKWTGLPKVEVESTGNPVREQPAAGSRRSYSSRSSAYKEQRNAERVTAAINGLLYEAGLFKDPVTGVWAYASQQGSNYALGASFNVQAGLISQEVTRATAAEGTLSSRVTQTETAITQKVSAGDIASTINQTAQSVLIAASKINLEGYVTIDELAADIASLVELRTTSIRTDEFTTYNGNITYLDAGYIETDEIILNGSDVASNAVSTIGPAIVDSSTGGVSIPFTYLDGSPGSPITFSIADTVYFRQQISAADLAGFTRGRLQGYDEGFADGTPASVAITAAPAPTTPGSNVSKVTVTVTLSDDSATEKYFPNTNVNVANVLNSVTLSGAWSGRKYTATASNGNTASTGNLAFSGSWGSGDNANLYSFTVKDGSTTIISDSINATNRYNAGRAAIEISGSWNGATYTATTVGKATESTVSTTLTAVTVYPRGNGYTVYPRGNTVTVSNYTRVQVNRCGTSHRVPTTLSGPHTIVDEDGYVWRNQYTCSNWKDLYEAVSTYYFEDDGTESTYYRGATGVTVYPGAAAQTYYTIPS